MCITRYKKKRRERKHTYCAAMTNEEDASQIASCSNVLTSQMFTFPFCDPEVTFCPEGEKQTVQAFTSQEAIKHELFNTREYFRIPPLKENGNPSNLFRYQHVIKNSLQESKQFLFYLLSFITIKFYVFDIEY